MRQLDEASVVSVIVCTHNGGRRLRAVVESLLHLQPPPEFEVIVVDNASTDGAATALQDLQARRLRVLREPKVGLANAREKGVANAGGDIIVFADDDNYLAEDYLTRAVEVMTAHPRAAAAGGYAEAVAACPFPSWFQGFYHYYGVGAQAGVAGLMPQGSFLRGAGLVVRKRHWIELSSKGCLTLTDRAGTSLSSGGDAELSLAWQLLGYELVYDARLHLRHQMMRNRLRIRYLARLAYHNGRASAVLDSYVAALRDWTPSWWPRALLHELRPSLRPGRSPISWSCGLAWRLGRIRQIAVLRGAYGSLPNGILASDRET